MKADPIDLIKILFNFFKKTISFYIFFYKNKSILNLLGLTHSIRNLSGRIMFHNFDIYKIYFDFKSVFQIMFGLKK
jgi:hypothetical protein